MKRLWMALSLFCCFLMVLCSCGISQGTGEAEREPMTVEVIAAAFDGDVRLENKNTMVILEDGTFHGAYINEGEFSIDLNGNDVTFEVSGREDGTGWNRCITVCQAGILHLKDSVGSGSLSGNCDDSAVFAAAEDNGVLTIDDVAISLFSDGASDGMRGHCFGSWNGGEVRIQGGEYDADVVGVAYGTEQPAKLYINGGLFGTEKARTSLYLAGQTEVTIEAGDFSGSRFGIQAAEDADLVSLFLKGGTFKCGALDDSGRTLETYILEGSIKEFTADGRVEVQAPVTAVE